MKKIASIIVGNKWRTFIGISFDELCETMEFALDDENWTYTDSDTSVSTGERVVFGSDQSKTFLINDSGIEITCTSVSYDPVQRAIFGVMLSESSKEKHTHSVSLIEVKPITPETEEKIADVLQNVASQLDFNPWDITHPRFNYSPLLKYKVKWKWKYWL